MDANAHLQRQLRFLIQSALAFDRGFEDEAIRIATVIRVMVHQTGRSTSLLSHLNAADVELLSTAVDGQEHALLYQALVAIEVHGDGTAFYRPTLDDAQTRHYIPASKWWLQTVHVQFPLKLTRKAVVLAAANQDGGAHVDASLDTDYLALTTGEFGWKGKVESADGVIEQGVPGAHFALLRQMAHELLCSPALLALAK